jgi:rRNA maturation RNase YbeY
MVSPGSAPCPAVEVQVAADFASRVDSADLRAAAEATLASEDQAVGALTLVVTGDAAVQEMNARYRSEDEVTDVLAFPAREPAEGFVEAPGAPPYLGDIVIAYPRAEAQAQAAGHATADELRLLVVHGTLHLLGYDHATRAQEATMWARQEAIWSALPRRSGSDGRSASATDAVPFQAEGTTDAQSVSQWRSDLPTSFRNAFVGLGYVLRTQRNARYQLVIGLLAVALAALLRISVVEWAILALTIGFVLVAEMFNTVAEAAVDAVTLEYHPLAKATKDIAAGAVVFAAVISVIVGLLLFGPRLWALVQAIR